MSDFINIDIDYGGVDALFDRLTRMNGLKTGLQAAGLYLKGKVAQYPPQQHRKVDTSQWSDRQRKAFFAKLRKGEIQVPYRRGFSPGSQRLGQRWTTATSNNGLTVTIGNNAGYAQVVQSAKKQAAYHKVSGWKTVEQVAKQEGAQAQRIAASYVRRDF